MDINHFLKVEVIKDFTLAKTFIIFIFHPVYTCWPKLMIYSPYLSHFAAPLPARPKPIGYLLFYVISFSQATFLGWLGKRYRELFRKKKNHFNASFAG
jgi:hypothetical protein